MDQMTQCSQQGVSCLPMARIAHQIRQTTGHRVGLGQKWFCCWVEQDQGWWFQVHSKEACKAQKRIHVIHCTCQIRLAADQVEESLQQSISFLPMTRVVRQIRQTTVHRIGLGQKWFQVHSPGRHKRDPCDPPRAPDTSSGRSVRRDAAAKTAADPPRAPNTTDGRLEMLAEGGLILGSDPSRAPDTTSDGPDCSNEVAWVELRLRGVFSPPKVLEMNPPV